MSKELAYPYLDKSERNRPGERWKDIPGFEGYQASNHGRVRSLDRYVSHKRTDQQFVKGRILFQNVKKHYNNYTKDFAIILQTTLMLENIRYDVVVRRLVYGIPPANYVLSWVDWLLSLAAKKLWKIVRFLPGGSYVAGSKRRPFWRFSSKVA